MRKHTKNTIKLVDLTYIADDAYRTFFLKKGLGAHYTNTLAMQ